MRVKLKAMDSQQQRGSITPLIVVLVVLAIVTTGGYIAYKANRQGGIVNPSLTSIKQAVNNVVDKSKTDTSDQQLDKDTQDIDNSLNSLDQDLSQADQGLNDKQGDLSAQ